MIRKQNKSLGFYLPSFFRLHISTMNSIRDFNKLSDIDFSVLFHEYVHFLQDVTTFYGFSNTHATVEYMRYANNLAIKSTDNKFNVPIQPDPSNSDNVLLNGHLCKLTYGDVEAFNLAKIESYQLLELPINIINSPIKEIEVVDVNFIDENGEESIFTFGAGCIMESMAYLLEELTCKSYNKSHDVPYKAAELLAQHIYPEFAKNKLNILALCDISLGISNPGKYFVKTLEEWKSSASLPETPEILYEKFSNGEFILNGSIQTNENHFQKLAYVIKSQLKGYFNDSLFDSLKEWIDIVIDSAVDIRLKQPTFIVDIGKGNIRENVIFKQIFSRLGTPLLTNDNNEFRFYHSMAFTKQIDIGYFWAINQIQNIFLGDVEPCDLIDFCSQDISNTVVDDRCKTNPWDRCTDKALCPFAVFWRHWGLTGFEPINPSR